MSYEYQLDFDASASSQVIDEMQRALQADGFASTHVRKDGSISVLIRELGASSWGEHASVALGTGPVVVAIHTGTPATESELLRRVAAALIRHGASGEFSEL